MEHKEAEAIFKRYLEGTCSDEEKAMVESWDLEAADRASAPLDEEVYQEIKQRAWTELQAGYLKPAASLRLWPKIVIAAAVTAIVFGVWFFNSDKILRDALDDKSVVNDIAPGKNRATLTLANGKTINLSDKKKGVIIDASKLTYSDGTTILSSRAKAKDPDPSKVGMTSVSTPRGGTYQVVLPDGSKVWLNADSRISFPAQFIGKERIISLIKGEAYFEVFKDKARPFLVKTALQEVEVLGTHFNINAYPDEATVKTTLLEGSVRVSFLLSSRANAKDSVSSYPRNDKGARNDVILRPSQQAILSGDEQLSVKEVNVSQFVSWQKGRFAYSNTPMEEVMRQLSRWYDITVVYESAGLKQQALSGSVNRYEKLSGILNALKYTSGLNFKIENRTVIVMAGK